MAANEDPKDVAATDKAYQAAVEAGPEKASVPAGKAKPAKAEEIKTEAKPAAAKPETVKAAPKVSEPVKAEAKPEPAKAAETPKAENPVAAPIAAKSAPKPAVAAKPVVEVKPVAEVKPTVETKPVEAKPKPVEKVIPVKAATPKPAVEAAGEKNKPVAPVAPPVAAIPKAAKTAPTYAFAGLFTQLLEDKTMDMSANFSGFQDAVTEAQTKAKEVFEKSTKMFGEVGDFTKGNVEAVIESGKILAEGVQSIGSELVAEGRTAFEIVTGDIKELAAAKSPTDFFKIQSDMVRKNFDSAVAYGSKNSETMLKLVSDVMAPISGRVSMAMEKVRSASV